MRVGVVDIGTNSTRLLVADLDEGGSGIQERYRESIVTRLGEGVDAAGDLQDAPMQRVFDALGHYREVLDRHGIDRAPAVLTSAVRDASNGAEFTAAVKDRYRLDARTIPGDEEARLSYRGATASRAATQDETLLVIDIGGGSTEMIVGRGGDLVFHVSTQIGVVRLSERHIRSDPPEPGELQALADDARAVILDGVPEDVRRQAGAAVAVAGTATSCAGIDLGLEPYDPNAVEGHTLALGRLDELLARLAQMTVAERREVPGLHPDRAPTIVAGVVILREVLRAFGLEQTDVSERDILWGVALEQAG